MKLLVLLLIVANSIYVDSCKEKPADQKSTTPKHVKFNGVHYNIHDIDRSLIMSRDLVEISGLAYDLKHSTLLTVNDELGYLYELNTTTGEIVSKKKFADLGDYEALEMINDNEIVISRSNGKLYFYDLAGDKNSTIVRTKLSTSNNIEGITHVPNENILLIACKGSPRIPGQQDDTKGKLICAFNLENNFLEEEPYMLIKDKELKQAVNSIYGNLDLSTNQVEGLEERVDGFSPSGLAIHPHTGELYILSAKGGLLVVVKKDKSIRHIHFLDLDLNVQAEGICFAPNGDMYISNEGQKGSGKIHVFNYQK